jgi:hypothetical protein
MTRLFIVGEKRLGIVIACAYLLNVDYGCFCLIVATGAQCVVAAATATTTTTLRSQDAC